MEAGVEAKQGKQSQLSDRDPRVHAARQVGNGEEGREMLEHARMGAELDEKEEQSALEWLLGDPKPTAHEVDVDLETSDGMRKLVFVLGRTDVRKIDEIEQRNINRATGAVDKFTVDCELVCEAALELRDATGRSIKLTSEEFRTVRVRDPQTGERVPTVLASAPMALEHRFRDQLGLISGVSSEIRRVAGFDPGRVGAAKRRLVEGSLG